MDKKYLINFRRLLILSAFLPLIHGAVRPIYNIAHMVNSIKEIDLYLSRGANVIEADVSFSSNGTALHTFHGPPCDCARFCKEQEDIEKYLAYVREITKPENINYKEQLVLLFLDLKISSLPLSVKATAGSDLAEKVISNLFEFGTTTSKIKLLLSIGHVSDYDFVLGFTRELERSRLQHLNAKIGWDTGLNDEVSDVISFWRQIQITNNIWLGDGISNCISPFYSLERLTEVLNRRDSKGRSDPIIDKVYHWTIDLRPNLRASLRFGVDGIITNHPERLYAILEEPGFSSKYRLATHDDDPWKRIQSYPHDKRPANANRIINKPTISRESVSDLLTSFSKYLGGFVRRRLPHARN